MLVHGPISAPIASNVAATLQCGVYPTLSAWGSTDSNFSHIRADAAYNGHFICSCKRMLTGLLPVRSGTWSVAQVCSTEAHGKYHRSTSLPSTYDACICAIISYVISIDQRRQGFFPESLFFCIATSYIRPFKISTLGIGI